MQTVNDYYARNRVTDDDPFEEHTLGAEEPEGADAAPLPSRLAGEEDEFVEIDLSDGMDDTGGAVPADTRQGRRMPMRRRILSWTTTNLSR